MSLRLEKATRIIRDVVSDVIQNRLSDPRIEGLVSVTRVQVSGDLHYARVYLSVLGTSPARQKLTVQTIQRAAGYVQSFLAKALTIRTCPLLSFELDDSLKKGFDVVQILDQLEAQRGAAPAADDQAAEPAEPPQEDRDEE